MGLLLLAASGAACAADDGIPALLKFAEQRQAPPAAPREDSARKPAPAPAAKPAAVAGADSARLTSLKQSLQQQAEKIRQLERQLAAAQAAAAETGTGRRRYSAAGRCPEGIAARRCAGA